MKRLTFFAMTSAAALALGACDSEDVENTPIDDVDELVDSDVNEIYPVGGELDGTQQANLEALMPSGVRDEYEANRAIIIAEAADVPATPSGDGAMAESAADPASSSDSAMASSDESPLPPRGAMTFDWLDRNADDRLSVAEYAIWALPTDPTDFAANDDIRPYLTPEQINEAAQTFFYFDDDGSTYLSQIEFQDARASTRPSLSG